MDKENKLNIVFIGIVIVLVGILVYSILSKNNNEYSEEITNNSEINQIDDYFVEEEQEMKEILNSQEENIDLDNTTNPDLDQNIIEENTTGTFEDYDESKLINAETGKVVIFFNASWCPSCRALKSDIEANLSNIPAGTTILSADYDTYTDLKKKYGVTTQHTLVQVDSNGDQIAKWSGGSTLETVLNKIQ